ncbi:hypothetical protein H4J46_02005 [Colwellia sp. MB02u-6]|uniref:hypothetical protein n=1 Tax=Colwellia sp. MB02u-6 TaxID=2759824 RepID=UPI0015F6BF95|nr:hypothetical protein [Colwellia sp. MB02u-6]MBA6326726.1 hypothetical protein [Colwellia sp. MB02u-6]
MPKFKGLLFDGKNPKPLWQHKNKNEAKFTLITLVQHWFESVTEIKYKVSTHHNYITTTDKWVKNTPKKANTLSENWVKKHFTITFDGMRHWVAQSILAKKPNN